MSRAGEIASTTIDAVCRLACRRHARAHGPTERACRTPRRSRTDRSSEGVAIVLPAQRVGGEGGRHACV